MDIKIVFLKWIFLKEELYMMQQEGLSILKVLTKCASSSDPFMDWCKPLEVGINALIWFYTDFWRSLYLQGSEWEHYSLSDKYCE